MKEAQKFQKGDWVRADKDLGSSMSHFPADCEAIVIGSYDDLFGGGDRNSFTLHIKGRGRTSWYYGEQLTLIETGRFDKLQAWEDEAAAERAQKRDLDWIFANGPAVVENPSGASVQALADCFGLTDLWGRGGEGVTYYRNLAYTLALAEPYLKAGDKAGWLARCESRRPNPQTERTI